MLNLSGWLDKNGFRCPKDPRACPLQPAFQTDLSAFEWWGQKPEVLADFHALMTGQRSTRMSWVKWYPIRERLLHGLESDSATFVDVGGSNGHDSEDFLEGFPQPKGCIVLQDLPFVIDEVKGLDPRILPMKHVFFTPQPVKGSVVVSRWIGRIDIHAGARVYYFSHVFHDWSDEQCQKTLQNVKPALKKGYSRLVINDIILPTTGASLLQAGMDINMMVTLGGIERTEDQWTELLAKKGFKILNTMVSPRGDVEGIIEAELQD